MFETVIKEFNFACMATKCRPYCLTCDHCQYALEQISNFASGSKTSKYLSLWDGHFLAIRGTSLVNFHRGEKLASFPSAC